MALLVHLLACGLGLGSWVAVNGLWVELPLIVNTLPEGWDLPSYLTVIVQMANLGPLFVTVMHKVRPGLLRENVVIYIILCIGVVSCFLLAFFWHETTVVGGAERSTAFFVITFFLSLVDCTSSVTFLPFMMQLPAHYVTSYFIGEGLSGFVPGLVALVQGVGLAKCVNATSANTTADGGSLVTQYFPPNFSTEVFFFILTAMMCVSLAAFCALDRLPRTYDLSTANLVPSDTVASVSFGLDNPAAERDGKSQQENEGSGQSSGPLVARPKHNAYQLAFIYFVMVWANATTNGLLPSVQTYSCMPYGHLAYHLSTALASMANPVACVFAMFFPNRSLVFLGGLSVLGTVFGGYNMAMAAMSPCPLLQNSTVGEALIVASWVTFNGSLSYVKVMMGVILRDRSHSALVWFGAAEQIGSLVGSVLMFPLVNVLNLFKSGDFCSTTCP